MPAESLPTTDLQATHFSAEEGLMPTHACPEYNAHLKEHEDLRNTATELQRKFKDGKATVTFQTVQLLNGWLTQHILKVDKHLAVFLNAEGIKLSGFNYSTAQAITSHNNF